MAKKTKVRNANPWDAPAKDLKKVAKNINSEVKDTPPPQQQSEPVAVIRVGKSFHKRAKRAAVDKDLSIREFIESLIDENTAKK
jgi:hypothetical protein